MISNKFEYDINVFIFLVLRVQLSINRYGLKHQNVPFLLPFCSLFCALQQVQNRSEFSVLSERCI